jgi:aminoglycoside N3'-acetyltransferase|tara:strand:+ start:414 stop:581 length:168 start_codon:yes stop_codon:yes gene_type:complete
MSQNQMKETAQEIADGLKRLGPNRVVALSVHVSKDLIEELEVKANKLVALLESAS